MSRILDTNPLLDQILFVHLSLFTMAPIDNPLAPVSHLLGPLHSTKFYYVYAYYDIFSETTGSEEYNAPHTNYLGNPQLHLGPLNRLMGPLIHLVFNSSSQLATMNDIFLKTSVQ